MRLPRPFFRLPLRFDVARLREEVTRLPAEAWAAHPNAIPGNSSVRLISVEGGENDDVAGAMRPTPHLLRSPYLQQVLASFGVVWSRSRLLRLAPGARVPTHADINHHWFYRVRVHVPILTRPEVRFHCDGETVHMAPGESWIFDNWRQHAVENPSPEERIHLVADTAGTAAFWQMVAASAVLPEREPLRFDAAASPRVLTERSPPAAVMPAAEVDLLLNDLRMDLETTDPSNEGRQRLLHYDALLNAFCRDWRQACVLHGADAAQTDFTRLRDGLRTASRAMGEGLRMRSNRVAAHQVLEGRVLRALLHAPVRRLDRPVFIIAAPRSGSTLLFETLASSAGVATVGGEGHRLFEGLPRLQPGPSGVDSNRLTSADVDEALREHVLREIFDRRIDSRRRPVEPGSAMRLVEKTPKNVLRIPFLDALFPDALFVFLWRDPRENVSSIIDAWRSGRFRTYAGLDGFDGPWSLLLPPGWRSMDGRPIEEIAAFQWDSANRTALDDLSSIPAGRRHVVRFDRFLRDPVAEIQAICRFAGLEFDDDLAARVANPLPPSRQTLSPPDAEKWRHNAEPLARVLPGLAETHQRLLDLG